LWSWIAAGHSYDLQSTLFQPVGGMMMIARAFARELGPVTRYNCKVTEIRQSESGVTVAYTDTKRGGRPREAHGEWCVCTIPASILGQIPMTVGAPLQNAINALSYGPSAKVGLQFKRRFWEQDESIYGGITFTDQVNGVIGYPNTGYMSRKGVLLGAYAFGPNAYAFTAMSPEERIAKALECGATIHPQYQAEFETGAAVAWHRVPWSMGCAATWDTALRAEHYDNLCAIDGRIVLAGEHASRIPAWQEGALLSSLDAVRRLHQRVASA
jgi:monoamine oxidase